MWEINRAKQQHIVPFVVYHLIKLIINKNWTCSYKIQSILNSKKLSISANECK